MTEAELDVIEIEEASADLTMEQLSLVTRFFYLLR